MTRIAAAELAQFNIRVNAVQPGVIKTGMRAAGGDRRTEVMERCARETPPGEAARHPEDCAPLYVFFGFGRVGFHYRAEDGCGRGILAESHII